MSTVERRSVTVAEGSSGAIPGFTVRWSIGRRALASSRPDLVDGPDDATPLDLVVDVAGDVGGVARAWLVDPVTGRRTAIELPPHAVRWTLDAEAGLAHVDAGEALRLTCRWPCHLNGSRRVPHLYGSTAATRALGLAGGRYELSRVDALGA